MGRAANELVRRSRHRIPLAAAAFLLLLLVSLLVPPAAAAVPSVQPLKKTDPAVLRTATPALPVTTPPPAEPARVNRTTIIQTVKIGTERPKVTVPTGIFLIIVAIAAAGLLAILYLLIRRNARSPRIQKKPQDFVPGNATLVGRPVSPASVTANNCTGPAVSFPPSLEKRFIHPEFIGEGGLARVFRAQNAKTGRIVAVKVPVRFDEVTGTHFTRDIVFWQGLEHPNIIRIWSSNILPVPYIEMEYAPSSLAATSLPLPEKEAERILLGIARGLEYAHKKGIVHRDIKPENILLSAEGIPKITDWGLGKSIGDTRQSSVIGFSPAYAAPEQIAPHRYGRPGPATDISQLGMLLYELLTGAPAFRGEGMHDLNTAILEDTPVIPRWNGGHGIELERIIRRCLAKKPEERYVSVADLIHDLEFLRTVPE